MMKNAWRLLLTMLFCVILCMGFTQASYAEEVIASGTCGAEGDNLAWTVNDAGTLTISGTGAMEDYTSASAVPWGAEDIYAVTVEEGVTHVGSYAFSGLFLDNVLLPESLESIGDNAFSGAAVTEAHFAGNLKQWRENVTPGSGNDTLLNLIEMDKDVTYQGEGFSLAKGVVTSTVPELPSGFKREYNEYVFEVVFVGVTEIGQTACGVYSDINYALTNMTSVTIPDGVTSIGNYAFQYCSSLTSVTIPGSVTSIGSSAFENCSSLTSVTILDGVTIIGRSAFENCSSLTSVTIPDSVRSIGSSAFYNCSGLTSVTIPDSVTTIAPEAFYNCRALTSVTIGNSVTIIGEYAFHGCSGLTSVTIPDSVTRIHNFAFWGCSSLTSVTIPDSVTSIGDGMFKNCSGLTSVTIPDSVTSIGGSAFEECSGLTNVTIPDRVTSIGSSAFFKCSSLTSVTIGNSVTTIGGYAFYCCSGLTNVTIPDSVTSIGNYAFEYCSSLTSVTIGNSVTSIGDETFDGCKNLQNVYYTGTAAMWDDITIGENNDHLINAVKHFAVATGDTGDCRWSLSDNGALQISGDGHMADYTEEVAPWYAYRGQITTISIKDTVTYLGSYALSSLENVASISGMEGVTGIGEGAFKDCTALATLTLPAAVTSVGQNAFSGCTLLTSAGPADSGAAIEFGWNKVIPANAFNGADCLETLTIPEGVTRVMLSAAANCPALSAVSLPSTLTNIQQSAFSGCTSLEEITLPDALKTLGASAFRDTGLTRIMIPESVTSIGAEAFSGCSSLSCVYYAGTVEQWETVSNNTGIPANTRIVCFKSLTPDFVLPASLTTIEDEAFEGGAFTYVKLPEVAQSIGYHAFADCPNLEYIYIPDGCAIDPDAFSGVSGLAILGASGGSVQTWAGEHGYTFIPAA